MLMQSRSLFLYLPGGSMVVGPCWGCGLHFTYDPHHVRSLHVDIETGEPRESDDDNLVSAEPICPTCGDAIDAMRILEGRPPAYGDAFDLIVQRGWTRKLILPRQKGRAE